MEYIIPIHGIIGSPESKGDKKQYFTYADFLSHLAKAQSADTIVLDIASDGGYCDIADKMINGILGLNKPISAVNSGNVASAASKLWCLADRNMRVFYPSKGVFLVHNPWNEIQGDSKTFLDASIELKQIESQYVSWYSEKTGTSNEIISELMAENIPLTPSQIEALGFATVINPTIQAFAKLKSNIEMDTKEINEKLSGFETMLNSIKALLTPKPKAIMLVDVNGVELEFPEATDASMIAVGAKTTAKDGSYIMVDGTTVVVANGLITEIIEKADDAEIEALKAELATVKTENETLKAEKTAVESKVSETVAQVEVLNNELTSIKALIKPFVPNPNTPPAGGGQAKQKFTYKR